SGYLHFTKSYNSGSQNVANSPNSSVLFEGWNHVSGVIDRTDGQMRLYLNGNLVGTSGISSNPASQESNWNIAGFGSSGFEGAIRDIILWDGALTDEDAQKVYADEAVAFDKVLNIPLDESPVSGVITSVADTGPNAASSTIIDYADTIQGSFSGRLHVPGEVDIYTFTLTEEKLLYWDTLNQRSDIYASLRGPGGVNISRQLEDAGDTNWTGNYVFRAPPGEYTLTFDGTLAAKGAYGLRLLDLSTAEPVAIDGSTIEGTIDTYRAAKAFTFTASAGDRVFLDVESLGVAASSASWRLIDPYGGQVYGPVNADDIDGLTFGLDGQYTLILEGDRQNGQQQDLSYRFAMYPIVSPPLPISLGGANPGGDVPVVEGPVGNALDLRGAEYLKLDHSPEIDLTGNVTLEMWVNPDRFVDTWIPLLIKSGDTSGNQRTYSLWLNSNGSIYADTIRSGSTTRDSIQTAGGYVTTGQWTHVAAVFDRATGTQKIYINGVEAKSESMGTTPGASFGESAPLYVGWSGESHTSYGTFTGGIDEIRLWSTVRTAEEIAAAYSSALVGDEENLALYLPLDSHGGGTTPDAGPNGLDAQLLGFLPNGITGTISGVGQELRYTFTLTEDTRVYFDSLTNRSDMRMLLTGPNGTYLNRHFEQIDADNLGNNNPILYLHAGEYTLLIQGDGDARGDFNLNIFKLADAMPIAIDTVISGELTPANTSHFYSFDATAGMSLFIDNIVETGDMEWRLIDPFGREVYSYRNPADITSQTLSYDGTYTFIVEGDVHSGARSIYSFALWEREVPGNIPLTLGDVTPVTISNPGDYQRFEFTLTDPSRLYMDSLEYRSNLRWALRGPDGLTITDRQFSATDAERYASNPLLNVGAGDYQLTIYGTDQITGDFEFLLLDVDAEKSELFFNDETFGVLPQENHATEVFFLNGTKHQAFSLDAIDRPATYTSWRLIGPSGQQVVSGRRLLDAGGFILPQDGEYLFLLEGNVLDAANTNNYRFILNSPSYPDAIGDTLEEFGVGSGIGHLLVNQSGFAPAEEDDGTGNKVLRLLDPLTANTLSGIAFSQTAEGPFDEVRWSFDYKVEPPSSGATGHGLVTEWLPSAQFGAGGSVSLVDIEANRSGAIGVSLDFVQSSGDGTIPHISLHYGSELLEVPLSDFGLAVADFHDVILNLEVVLTRTDGGTSVSVIGFDGTTAATYIDGHFIGGFDLTDGRVGISARSNTEVMGLTIDNVAIGTTAAAAPLTLAYGDEITGDLTDGSSVDRYRFSVTETTRVVMDPRTNNGNLYWSLSGPTSAGGTRFDRTDANYGSGSNFITLLPGDYLLNVYTNNSSTGSYAFAMLDVASATPFDIADAVEGTVDPAKGTQIYSFDWPGGEPFYFKTDYLSGSQDFYYRIVMPDGTTVVERNHFNSDYETGNLSQAGTYHLLIEGRAANTSTGDYRFQVYSGTLSTQVLTPDTLTTGTIEAPLDRHGYTFDLAADGYIHLDGQTTDNLMRMVLTGPTGTLYSNEMRRSDGYYRSDSTAIWAPAGSYTLTIDPSGLTTGAYSFAVRQLSAATPITPGEQVDATYGPGSTTKIFSFTGTTGDQFYLDRVSGDLDGRWKILNPYGTLTTSGSIDVDTDHQSVTLNATGTFYLMIEGDVNDSDSRTHSFRLLPLSGNATALTLGERVEDELALPGETQTYTFTASEETKVYMDAQSPNNGNFRWILSGPRGTVSDRAFTQSDAASTSYPPFFTLVPGDYSLTVYANSGVTGAFSLQVLDHADATPVTLGTLVEGQLAPGSETHLYTFEGTEGDRYFFDSVTGNSLSYWRVLDPYGREILERYFSEDQDTTTLQETGTYTVLIEGRRHYPDTRAYSFNIYANPIIEPIVLAGLDGEPAPDLTVDSFSIDSPAPIRSGDTIDVSWALRNSGTAPVDAVFNTRLTIRRVDTGAVLADVMVPTDSSGASAIAEDGTVSGSATLTLPPGATSVGDLRISLRADVNNNVVEQNLDGTAELNNGADIDFVTELAPNSDLVATDLTVTPTTGWLPGQTVTVDWTLTNQGTKDADAPWTERLVVTNTSTGRVVESLDLREMIDPILAGQSLARSVEFGWPGGSDTTGVYRFDVIVDAFGEVFETNLAGDAETNNTTFETINSAPDLIVTEVSVAEAAPEAGGSLTISWTTRNEGAATTPGNWFDRVWVRNLTTGQTLHLIEVAIQDASLAPGEEGTQSVTLDLPDGSAGVGTIRVEVEADRDLSHRSSLIEARDGISAHTAENNNSNSTDVTSVTRPYPNLVATITGVPGTARGGETTSISWQVTNTGDRDTVATGWTDRVYLSSDAVLDASDELLAAIDHVGALAQGADYAVTTDVDIPVGIEGDFYLLTATDEEQVVVEPDTRADNVDAAAISLTSPYSDLTVQTVVGPTSAKTAGETATISWRVANEGPDALTAPAGGWVDRVYLSTDGTVAGAVVTLGSFVRESDIAVGSSYSRSEEIELPPGYVGDFFVVVQTNPNGAVFEGIGAASNEGASTTVFNLAPAPAPDLQVSVVTGPDAIVPGLATDVTFSVTNAGEATARGPWTDEVLLTGPGLGSGTRLALVERTFDLDVGEGYEVTVQVTIPNVAENDYQIAVRTDRFADVFEGGREDNTTADDPISLRHPNLTVSELSLPDGLFESGDTVRLDWSVLNAGAGAATSGWTDRIWLSQDETLDADDILLADRASDAGLPFAAGATAAAFLDIDIPIEVSGAWFVLVETDADNAIVEPAGEDDNASATPLQIALAPYADLEVTEVIAPSLTVDDPAQVEFTWTVANTGTGAGITDTWVDRIFVSADAIIGDSDDVELGRFTHTGGLVQGETYSRTESLYMPAGFNGRFTLYVTTDAENVVFENEQEADNTLALHGFFDVAPIPYADLVVTNVTAPASAQSGQPMTLSWTVENRGIGLTSTSRWDDRVYLADNPDGTGRIYMGGFDHIGYIAPSGNYIREAEVTLPEGWEGPAYFFVEVPGSSNPSSYGAPYEFVFTDEGNKGISSEVGVLLSPPPNLIVTSVTAPAEAPEGSAIDVTWTVKNDGIGPAEGSWTDRLYLRNSDTAANERDILIGTYTFNGPLQANTSYTRREQLVLPEQTNNRYDLIVITDYGNDVYEHSNEDDNESGADAQVLVTVLPRPDLQVSSFEAPDELTAGATGSLRWTVINQGPVATTTPNWTDSVYLSLDQKITFDDIRLGSYSNEAALGTGESYLSQLVDFRVPERFRGTVYLLVNTDSGNAVGEWPNENNNLGVHELYVEPIPFADIVVHDVVTPFQAFEGNQVSVNYTVTNRGAGDTNLGTWTEQLWLTLDKNRPHPGQGDVLLKTIQYTGGILEVGAGYDRQETVTLPDNLVSGNYYITPWVDPYATLLEDTLAVNINEDDPHEINSNNYKAGGADLVGQEVIQIIGDPPPVVYPELGIMVDAVTPASIAGVDGQNAYEVSYTLTNNGDGPARGYLVYLYLTETASLNAAGQEKWRLGRFDGGEIAADGGVASFTQNFLLPPGLDGKYLIAEVLQKGDTDLSNNLDTEATDVVSPEPNLIVTEVVPPAEAYSGEQVEISYSILNDSATAIWSGTQYWQDQIWLSKDPTFIRNRATLLRTEFISNATPLEGGQSYTRSFEATLPPGIEGDYFIYVFTNVGSGLQEQDRSWPVNGGSLSYASYSRFAFEEPAGSMLRAELPVIYAEPDLQVTDLQVPAD
ncbi:MAG: hypothetical protein GY926_14780, partial [bacterium]|nr:hypothetical protein [bacterium]